MVFWLVETAVVNSYILYKETVHNPMTHVAYRRSVVESLASRYIVCAPPRRLVGRPRKRSHPDGDVPERLNHRLHIVEQRTQRNCVVCRAAGRKSRPVYFCKTCPETPQLCIGYCFERYTLFWTIDKRLHKCTLTQTSPFSVFTIPLYPLSPCIPPLIPYPPVSPLHPPSIMIRSKLYTCSTKHNSLFFVRHSSERG